MARKQDIFILYVGTTKIAFLKAHRSSEDRIRVEALSTKLAGGFDRGIVRNLSEASETVSGAVRDVAGRKSEEILSCRLVVANEYLKSYSFQSSIYFHGNHHPISLKDVREVIAQTRSVVTVPLDEVIVQAVPQEFLVNDLEGVQNPVGLEASRIGVTLKLLTLNFFDYQNLLKVCERSELEVSDVVPGVLAAAEAVLRREEKQEGAVLCVVGGTATHFACYRSGILVEVRTLPIGGDCITESLGKKMNLEYLEAQRLKESFGAAVPKLSFEEELIPIPRAGSASAEHLKRRDLDAFLAEGLDRLFGEIGRQLGDLTAKHAPVPNIVFTGGGAKLDGFLERARDLAAQSVRIGAPDGFSGPNALIGNAAYSAAIGAITFSALVTDTNGTPTARREHWLVRAVESARNWIFEYF